MGASADLLVFAWGNSSRGDDGAGPEIARRIRALARRDVTVIEDMQLQIEHVTDIRAEVPVLFVDASVAISQGIALERVWPDDDPSVTTHAVSPSALLKLYTMTMQAPLPPAYQLHIAAESFELGEQAGGINVAAVEDAWQFFETLFARPATDWAAMLESSRNDRQSHTSTSA